jgi:hypothetical protein
MNTHSKIVDWKYNPKTKPSPLKYPLLLFDFPKEREYFQGEN